MPVLPNNDTGYTLSLPYRQLRLTKYLSIALLSFSSIMLLASLVIPDPDNKAIYGYMPAFFCVPFGLFLGFGYIIRSRYRVFVFQDSVVVHEPPVHDMIVKWSEITQVIETGKGNLQLQSANPSEACKIFIEVEGIEKLVGEIRND